MRKSEAYGDVEQPPELDAEEVAMRVEEYLESVKKALGLDKAGE